ncbi:hypothetical protein H6P81_015793 [Aristolochia fimbriata]|uniref:Uncharacterized protein n=1 Tax=Aristolochia fimbriata TaxID=158543 RepID=A0AAV7EB48_ARIFI|nr:hypothetical protein H6P81_015793 [Aristolochia fimbriata]
MAEADMAIEVSIVLNYCRNRRTVDFSTVKTSRSRIRHQYHERNEPPIDLSQKKEAKLKRDAEAGCWIMSGNYRSPSSVSGRRDFRFPTAGPNVSFERLKLGATRASVCH